MKELFAYWLECLVATVLIGLVALLCWACLPEKRICCDGISVRCCCVKGLCRCWVNGKTCNDECYAEAVRRGFVK